MNDAGTRAWDSALVANGQAQDPIWTATLKLSASLNCGSPRDGLAKAVEAFLLRNLKRTLVRIATDRVLTNDLVRPDKSSRELHIDWDGFAERLRKRGADRKGSCDYDDALHL